MNRLLNPSSVAVVGASERPETYSSETLLNLARLGFEGEVWGVNPRRSSVHGRPCVPSLSDLPSAPDAVVVAIPAAGVPAVIEEAGSTGCGGAVVYAAGFGETSSGVALEASLRDAARRYSLPVCGPNCDGLIALHSRAALWGDALAAPRPGHVALVSQSGNLVVNALATRRGLRLHTAISSGNEAVVTTPDWVEHLAREPGVRSIALLIEAEGDGARLCEALAVCADEGVGVAVLKVGASTLGAAAAAAHTGAVAGDHRIFRALVEESGAAWAADVHELLELAKALAVPRARPRGGGLAILTCSGGDSGLGADEAERLGLELPPLADATVAALRERLPEAATIANPLDYTAMIWGEVETLRDIVRIVGDDPAIGHVLVFYDRPPGITGVSAESWDAVERGIHAGADAGPVPVLVASTLPELLDDDAAWRFAEAGVPAIAGLRTGVAAAAALAAPPADAARIRSLVTARMRPGRALAEHEAKALLRERGVPVPRGVVATDEEQAVAAFRELGGPVALKVSAPDLRHKTAAGAIALDVRDERGMRAAVRRLDAPRILVEEMAQPGPELFIAVRRDAVVHALVIGLGGVHVEALDRVAIVPLPADDARIARTLGALNLPAAAPAIAAIAHAAEGLALLECNPVIVHPDGAVVVDAVAQEVAPVNAIAHQLGEVGLPAPIHELAARRWDVVVVGGGHNGLTAAAYLARAGQKVLVLERRDRLGGACTLERPFADPDYVVSPCAYVVGLLDELVIEELNLRRRGLHFDVADPNLWVPFGDGTSFGQWLDDDRTNADLTALGVSDKDRKGYWEYEHLFDEIRRRLRTGDRDTWVGESPTRAEIEDLLRGEQTMIDVVFEASIAEVLDDHMSDQRLKDALFGQGIIGAWAGPHDKGTASIKLMHYQGDLEGQGPVWGYVRGGMGMVSFAIADAAFEAGATLATGVKVATILPEEGVVLENGTTIDARVVICNADPKRFLAMVDDLPADYEQRLSDWKIRSPVVKFNAALSRLPQWTAAPDSDFPARATVDLTTGLDDAQRCFERCAAGEPAVGFGEIYVQTGYDSTPAPPGKHLMSVFGQYAPYDFDWAGNRGHVARQFIDLIARFAPDFPDVLEHYEVLGPPDIEERIGLTAGNIFQGETMPDQMWEHRLSSRTPVPGVYLCGAATHPAGSVIALNGRNAAMAVLEDARVLT